MIYLITYDKSKPFNSYQGLKNAIQSCSTSWWHHMNTTWLVKSDLTIDQIFEVIKKHIVQEDRLLIIEIHTGAKYQGWLHESAWKWLEYNTMDIMM